MKSLEVRLNEAIERYKHQCERILSLQAALNNARIDSAFYERQLRMTNAGLPNDAKDRLNKAFENSNDNAGLREAINTEKRRYL